MGGTPIRRWALTPALSHTLRWRCAKYGVGGVRERGEPASRFLSVFRFPGSTKGENKKDRETRADKNVYPTISEKTEG
jgi:hypothetical protein